jgi:hypothetical protein
VLLESAVRNMRNGTEKWTWVFDMAGYDSRNSPRIDVTLRVLQLVASHYPERLAKVFIVDAPTIFWVLFKVGFVLGLVAGWVGWLGWGGWVGGLGGGGGCCGQGGGHTPRRLGEGLSSQQLFRLGR